MALNSVLVRRASTDFFAGLKRHRVVSGIIRAISLRPLVFITATLTGLPIGLAISSIIETDLVVSIFGFKGAPCCEIVWLIRLR